MAVQLGDSGPEVQAVQAQLVALGFPIATDGVFGARTDDAVRGFQLVVGLVPDGVVGPLTNASLASTTWDDIKTNSLVFFAMAQRVLTDTVTTALVNTTLDIDVKWPVVLADQFPTPDINGALDWIALTLIDSVVSEPAAPPGSTANSLKGELGVTLIAPSIAAVAGVLTRHLAGAAHPHPVIQTANLDLAADRLIAPAELFMPGADWLTALRNIVLLSHDPAPGNDAAADNYRHLALGPDGIDIYMQPEQVGLPLAAGVQKVRAAWVRIEGIMRPSIIARAFGGVAGGPLPIIS